MCKELSSQLCINSTSVTYFLLRNKICFTGEHKSF